MSGHDRRNAHLKARGAVLPLKTLVSRCTRVAVAQPLRISGNASRDGCVRVEITQRSPIARVSRGLHQAMNSIAYVSRRPRVVLAQASRRRSAAPTACGDRAFIAYPSRSPRVWRILAWVRDTTAGHERSPSPARLIAPCPYPSPQRIGLAASPAREIIGADPRGIYKGETKRVTTKARYCAALLQQ